ncbi:VWA domain-containing protein [Bacillus halotolerans]|uniref:VWA domain-containing protein n=1 Tax=Bacillus halotolerans TaxID=260554 RepID=UPI00298ED0DF|nr:VWA domain-containing protein [Bacillus halotolerans]WPC79752.1 VWA domain-containing protein [Bacillus halotolerans]
MDKLQEIKARISKLKGYENAKPTDHYWMTKEHIDFLIDRTELAVKQREIIEENKRQQEVTVHQFRQAQEELQRLNKENDRFRKALHQFADMKNIALSAEYVIQRYSEYALQLLNGGELEGDAE